MKIDDLILYTKNQVSLLTKLVETHATELRNYPTEQYSPVSFAKMEHCYNTLLRLNDLLVKSNSDK